MSGVKYTFIGFDNDPTELEYVSGQELVPILKEIGAKTGIEIGVDEGYTSWYFLKELPELRLYGVDPYAEYIDWNGNRLNQIGRDDTLQKAIDRLKPYADRHVLYRATSDEAASKFEDESYDFIFIDGLHEYDQLKKDCANYFSKIRKGGVFAGHDYTAINGVRKAVDEFAKEVGATPIYLSKKDVWYWIKE